MDISVIVPVYNVERYLTRCLDSLFSQTFNGTFEVIAVDDNSSDNSLHLLYKYQQYEKRLIIIRHTENRKLSIARATGMKYAKGKYVMHVDSDDWLLPDAFSKLHRKFKETNADVIVFNYSRIDHKGRCFLVPKILTELLTRDKLIVQLHFLGATVNKIVKRELTLNMLSGEAGVNSAEDLLYSTEILLRADKICLTPEILYIYYINKASITWTVKPNHIIQEQVIVLKQLHKIVAKYNADNVLVKNILDYLANSISLIIFQSFMLSQEKSMLNKDLLKAFSNYPQMNLQKIKYLKIILEKNYYSFFFVYRNYGLGTIMHTFLKRIKLLISAKV